MGQLTKSAVIVACFAALASCTSNISSPSSSDTTSVSGKIEGMGEFQLDLFRNEVVGDNTLMESDTTDADGRFAFTLPLEEPGDYNLKIGREQVDIYLHPGDNLRLTADLEDLPGTMLYEGTGSAVNNYLAEKERKEIAFITSMSAGNFYKLPEDVFIESHEELHDILQEHYDTRAKAEKWSDAFARYEKYQLLGSWINPLANYPTYHGYYTRNDTFEPSAGYENYMKKVDLKDGTGIVAPEYRAYLYSIVQRRMNDMVTAEPELQEDWPAAFLRNLNMLLDDPQYGNGVKNYFLASTINDYINFFGPDGIAPYVERLKSRTDDMHLIAPIEMTYDKWARLVSGAPAPDFEYQTADGKNVSLSDFRGKVVYIDVWATWCGPCKREFPSAKVLKDKYASEDDLVFLYVSVDENESDWRAYLENDPEFAGVHLITGTGWKSKITEDYMIKGIPRYMLIDKEGKIASASAPRPSAGAQLESMIDKLLEGDAASGD